MNEKNKKELYSEIEDLIIRWMVGTKSNDGTKTAGSLTRDIMKLVEAEIRDGKIENL